MLPAKERLMRASDIMILVRKRDHFVSALSRALKLRNIPIAGADRLQLTKHMSVRDLMALARFVLQPKDDLSLACVLKSPLFRLAKRNFINLQRTVQALFGKVSVCMPRMPHHTHLLEMLSKI